VKQELLNEIAVQWDSRTKPQGSLGRLEELARDYCVIRGLAQARIATMGLYLYAGDHGITDEGVSLYPKAVTRQMLANFEAGGAAVNVLARQHGVEVKVVDAGVGEGTKNFAQQPAMTAEECAERLLAGRVDAREAAGKYELVGLGEMGIGNTTSAAAILAAIGGYTAAEVSGRGTGLDDEGVRHKAQVIDAALEKHALQGAPALEVLQAVGGFEIARMAGFLLEAGCLKLPVMLDGFITCAAALVAVKMEASTREVLFFSHRSAERGHGRMLEELDGDPILDLGMRLGEGSGAILGMHLLKCAMNLYNDMASFESASVSRSEA
jgi:nicotinate-nucleotide--dimethylbenzimidazole phosphoribosyltransferase